MTYLYDRINETLKIYKDLLKYYNFEIKHSPDGSLTHEKSGARIQFFNYRNNNGKITRMGINRNPMLIKALARKEFDKRAVEILSYNIELLEDSIKKQIPFDTGEILKSMKKAYSFLPEEYFFDCDRLIVSTGLNDEKLEKVKQHEEWWKKPYEEYWGYPENKTKRTSRGQKVRSISELLIAETLYKYSIPFHYEEIIEVGGKRFAPDFTFEGFDYKNFYLDYFGMMDDPKYAKRNFLKLDDYYDIGLVPGGNLIVAFDTKGIMNVNVIESIIENEIFPRL